MPVAYRGRPCNCGNIGCAEAHASTWALPAIAKERPGFDASALAREPRIDFAALFRAAREGDAFARELAEECSGVWAAAVVALIHAYDPEIVVIGGNVMRAGDAVLNPIRRHVEKHAWTPWGQVRVVAAALGNSSALLGSLPLLKEKL